MIDTRVLETEWIEFGKEAGFRKKTEKGSMSAGFHSTTSSLKEAMTDDMPDGPERAKLFKFLEKLWKGPATLLVKDKDTPLGWATMEPYVSWGSNTDGGKEAKIFAKTSIIIKEVAIASWAEDRKVVAANLLKGLLEKAQQSGADAMELREVDAEDALVIDIFREAGFERIATNYTMKKSLL